VRFIVRGNMCRNHSSRHLLLFWVREELQHSCKEESPSLSLSLSLLEIYSTREKPRSAIEKMLLFFFALQQLAQDIYGLVLGTREQREFSFVFWCVEIFHIELTLQSMQLL
jgi:hypothetical protein